MGVCLCEDVVAFPLAGRVGHVCGRLAVQLGFASRGQAIALLVLPAVGAQRLPQHVITSKLSPPLAHQVRGPQQRA